MKLLLTRAEAAEALGVGVKRVIALVADGEVGFVSIGEDERIPASELQRWVSANMRHRECRSADGAIPLPMPGGSGSRSTGGHTRSRGGRRTKEPPRPWNENCAPPLKPAEVLDLARQQSAILSRATDKSTGASSPAPAARKDT